MNGSHRQRLILVSADSPERPFDSRTAWAVSTVLRARTLWLVGRLWTAPTASVGGEWLWCFSAHVKLLLLIIVMSSQTLEISSNVLETVLDKAISTTDYSRRLMFGFD